MTGILLIDKPRGITSAAALNEVKRRLGKIKIGHTGTLDPQATGLLVCLLGSATSLAQNFAGSLKRYAGEIVLGIETSTDDLEGEVLSRSEDLPSEEAIRAALPKFIGEIEQVPPRVSAVKVDGRRAYDRARKGEDFILQSRKVTVHSFELFSINEGKLGFEVLCNSGTYIRSLARDLGKLLGCGGALGSLRRIAVGPFDVRDSTIPEAVTAECIRPWWELFPDALVCSVSGQLERNARKGLKHSLERELNGIDYAQNNQNKNGEVSKLTQYEIALLKNQDSQTFFGIALRGTDGWKFDRCL